MLIDNVWMFQVTRFLSGIPAGMGAVLGPITAKEMLPSHLSAKFAIGLYMWFIFAMVVTSSMGLI